MTSDERDETWSAVQAVWFEKAAIYRQRADGTADLLDHLLLAELGIADPRGLYAADIVHESGRELARFRSGGRLAYVNEWLLDRQSCSFASLAELEQAVPEGDYACRVRDSNGEHRLTLPVRSAGQSPGLPPPPTVSLIQDGCTGAPFDGARRLEVAWTPFAPSIASQSARGASLFSEPTIFFLLDNGRGETVLTSGSGARGPSLPATARSFEIPAGALEPGMRYTAFVSFIDFQATAQSEGGTVMGAMVHSATVEVPFETQGEPRDSRSCPPIEQRACYRWPGKTGHAGGLAPWPVDATGLMIETPADLRSAPFAPAASGGWPRD